jgi:hypothetical protein
VKHFRKLLVIFISVFLLLSMSGCAELLRIAESPNAREQAEDMLDAIIDNDFDEAYDLIKKYAKVEDFRPVFRELADYFKGVEDYELSLLSVNYNTAIDNGKTFKVVYSQYKLVCDKGDFVVAVNIMQDSGEMFYFYVASFEKNTYTLDKIKEHAVEVWVAEVGDAEDNGAGAKIKPELSFADNYQLLWIKAKVKTQEVVSNVRELHDFMSLSYDFKTLYEWLKEYKELGEKFDKRAFSKDESKKIEVAFKWVNEKIENFGK